MFSDDGKFAMGYLTLDWTCLRCHNDKDKTWAGRYAKGIHKFVRQEGTAIATSPPPTATPTPKAAAFEALFAAGALLVAVLIRRR
jgi:MYXO-CTERM domain-containing protein